MASNIHKLMTLCFWCGWLAHIGITMFIQDWLGLDSYVEFVAENWVNMSYMWGAAIFAVPILYYYNKRNEVANLLREERNAKT